ncbi:hypothetical protein JAAARDRAFT_31539 [Jaapia argillacea MUCL 33604]|uniref:Uncharacterized protein n=1 Tax=Jaapia argillacea MUCL 33604 TaxID=933084 RepID=A0A067Q0G3_9AGAM|nr:hypothetical protein JAAARDRAFT_31539 [Jaapia argillacea MUCL 33604]
MTGSLEVDSDLAVDIGVRGDDTKLRRNGKQGKQKASQGRSRNTSAPDSREESGVGSD